jgi:hypothetical protein
MWWFLLLVVLPVYVGVAYLLYFGRHSPSITWRGSPRTKEEAEERERREQEVAEAWQRHPWMRWVPFAAWIIVAGGAIVASAYFKLQRK